MYARDDAPEYMMPVVYALDSDVDTTSMADDAREGEGYVAEIADSLKHAGASWSSDISDHWFDTAVTAGAEYSIYVPSPDSAESLEHADKAYIKFINVDFPTSVEGERLSNYTAGAVSSGYRVAAFEYVDFMDDDIAFYNTIGLSAMNDFATDSESLQNHSRYYMKVKIEDATTKAYIDIYNLCKNSYDAFMKYYEMGSQAGNIDLETGAFTRMFKEGMAEKYPTPGTQPWTRAAYVYEAMRQIMSTEFHTASSDTASIRESIFQKAAKWEELIGPISGTHFGAARLRHAFLVLLNHLFPQPELAQSADDPGGTYQATAESMGLISPGQTFGENAAYDRMMDMVFPDLSWEAASSYPDGHDQGMLFHRLASETSAVYLRGQKAITEPIYGNLLTSAMGQDDFISTAATPAGATALTSTEARLTVQPAGGTWRLSMFYVSLIDTNGPSGGGGTNIWINSYGSASSTWGYTPQAYDSPSFTKWLNWINGIGSTWYYAEVFQETRRLGTPWEWSSILRDASQSAVLGYPTLPSSGEVFEPDGSWEGECVDVTQQMTTGKGVVIPMDEWAALADGWAAAGSSNPEVVIAYSMNCVEGDYTESSPIERPGFMRIAWRKFQQLLGNTWGDSADVSTSLNYQGDLTDRHADDGDHGQAWLVGETPFEDPYASRDYVYPGGFTGHGGTPGNHLVLYVSNIISDGLMVNGKSWNAGPGAVYDGNYMAIGPVLTERTQDTGTVWGYDL